MVNFFSENLKIFKRVALPLFLIVVLSSNIDQYLNLQIENALRDPQGAEKTIYFYGFISILSSVIFPVLLTITALFAVSSLSNSIGSFSFTGFFKKNLNQVFIEMIRAWGKTLLWSLLLILPGLWKYLEYTFVPFVVTLSKKYDAGELDALKASSQIVRKNAFKILGVLLLFHMFIPAVMASFFDSYRLFWKTPAQSLFLNLIDTYLLLISVQILFYIFKNEVNHDAYVQLERH
ncbi:hypothetical protein D3C87_189130 [compost metagenome]